MMINRNAVRTTTTVADSGDTTTRRTRETTITETLAAIDTHLEQQRRCIHWLIENGIQIISSELRRDLRQPRITVEAKPQLMRMLNGTMENVRRRYDGYRTTLTWGARCRGCQIEWDETSYGDPR